MKKLIFPIFIALLSLSFTMVPTIRANNSNSNTENVQSGMGPRFTVDDISGFLYTSLELDQFGLSREAFNYAYKGYQRMLSKKLLSCCDYLTICDFSQSSKNKRLYIIDLSNNKLLLNTYVAHGRNSGGEFATRFSNRPESLESSLGFYITKNTYFGEHGLALKIQGIDPGFNDKALKRNIVIHGADYIGENWLKHSEIMGRSYGCPAVPQKESKTIINTIKNGNCLFIYHPSKNYLLGSKILNF